MSVTEVAPLAVEAEEREDAVEDDVGLAPRRRLALVLATWLGLCLATPGLLWPDGSALLATAALVPWVLAAHRPGRRAFLVEWLAASLGFVGICAWMAYVWWGTYLFVGPVPALYVAAAGVLLRRLVVRVPLVVAAPAAWLALETLRQVIEPPLAFGWMRQGEHFAAVPVLAESARVWGAGGLTLVSVAAAAGVADAFLRWRAGRVRSALFVALGGLAPAALGYAFGALVPAPETVDGPRLLLVQPAIPQHRKQSSGGFDEMLAASMEPTIAGLRAEGAAIDLVCWGETMLPMVLMASDVLEAYRAGVRPPAWTDDHLQEQHIRRSLEVEGALVGRDLLGPRGLLPDGTSFLAGAEYYLVRDDALRRANAVVLWDDEGERVGVGAKVHLVPGAEQMAGLERLGLVLWIVKQVAGYVPDLVPWKETAVLPLETRSGRTYRFGITVCYDNAFDDPYTRPLREGEVDFHLVASNEAWYEASFEADQMVAYSRLVAIMTGRSFVRVTNSGVSAVFAPDGSEVARLRVDGRDRMVPGFLAVTVPVPAPQPADGGRTPYVRAERGFLAAWIAAPFALFLLPRRRGSRNRRAESR